VSGIAAVPAASAWGMTIMWILVPIGGSLAFLRLRRVPDRTAERL